MGGRFPAGYVWRWAKKISAMQARHTYHVPVVHSPKRSTANAPFWGASQSEWPRQGRCGGLDPRGHGADGTIGVIGWGSADAHACASSRPARSVRRDEARNRLSDGALNGNLVRDAQVMANVVPYRSP